MSAIAVPLGLLAGAALAWLLVSFPRLFAAATLAGFGYGAWQCIAASCYGTAAFLLCEGVVLAWIMFDVARSESQNVAAAKGRVPEEPR